MLNLFLIFLQIICVTIGMQASSIALEAIRSAKVDEIRKYMNESVDPCQNFFEFACGNWKTFYPASETKIKTSAFDLNNEDFDDKLVQLMQTKDEMDSESELKVKNYFHSCINYKPNNSVLIEKQKSIANEFGQMPAMAGDKWQDDDFDWVQTVAEIQAKYGFKNILSTAISQNEIDHMSYDIIIEKPYFEIFLRDSFNETCTRDLEKILGLESTDAEQIANELVKFAAALSEANQKHSKNIEHITVQELHDKYYPDLDIKRFMHTIYGYIPTEEIINLNPSYLENLIKVMKKTPKKVVANYISYRLIYAIFAGTGGVQKEEKCIEEIEHIFPDILSYMFYRTYNLKEKEQFVQKMWQFIETNLEMVLESSALYWFDDAAREYALEKLHSVQIMVPKYNVSYLDNKYGHLHINRSDFVENGISIKVYRNMEDTASLNGDFSRADYELQLSTPYYTYTTNDIIMPIPVITSDYFSSPSFPNAFSYGRLGYAIAHEVLHGFSGEGRQYNKLGDKITKREESIEKDFNDRIQCLYDQYTNYTFGGKPLFQVPGQDENAADIAGLQLAYQSYRRWYEDSARTEEELAMETLPNLNYTNNQLFFISYSQFWCAHTLEERRAKLARKVHSPPEFRAFVPLINFDEFSKEFKCAKGSPMNPKKKCRIY